uniref:Uncharacterized protein n=1 Tax=Arundo donax TaxID=35708 RepID=A0A0A9B2A2_ARUDO
MVTNSLLKRELQVNLSREMHLVHRASSSFSVTRKFIKLNLECCCS